MLRTRGWEALAGEPYTHAFSIDAMQGGVFSRSRWNIGIAAINLSGVYSTVSNEKWVGSSIGNNYWSAAASRRVYITVCNGGNKISSASTPRGLPPTPLKPKINVSRLPFKDCHKKKTFGLI